MLRSERPVRDVFPHVVLEVWRARTGGAITEEQVLKLSAAADHLFRSQLVEHYNQLGNAFENMVDADYLRSIKNPTLADLATYQPSVATWIQEVKEWYNTALAEIDRRWQEALSLTSKR